MSWFIINVTSVLRATEGPEKGETRPKGVRRIRGGWDKAGADYRAREPAVKRVVARAREKVSPSPRSRVARQPLPERADGLVVPLLGD